MDPTYTSTIDSIEHSDLESETNQHTNLQSDIMQYTDEYVEVPDIDKKKFLFVKKNI